MTGAERTIVLAYDVGPGAGLGHRARIRALATALEALEIRTEEHPLATDAPTPALPVTGTVVVLDSYRHRADDPAAVQALRRVAVDDLERDLDVDVVVDAAPAGPTRAPHRAITLLGLDHALVDPSLRGLSPAPVGDAVTSILVTTGGTDAAGIGVRVASELHRSIADATIRLVVGPWGTSDVPPGIESVISPERLATDLAAADLVVCAAGVTMLEALTLGRPVVAVQTADNQRRYFEGLREEGAVVAATTDTVAGMAASVAADSRARRALARRARQLVDGLGAERVAKTVASLL